MEVMSQYGYRESIVPPSPALTNPDMILPYNSRDSTPSPSYRFRRSLNARFIGQENMTGGGYDMGSKPGRPMLPGAWQTDESISTILEQSRTTSFNSQQSGPANGADHVEARKNSSFQDPCADDWNHYEEVPDTHNEDAYQKDQHTSTIPLEFEEHGHGHEYEHEHPDGTHRLRAILDEDENDPNSHAALSIRAEEILANAKKRLMAMEGNLNRARSLSVTSSNARSSTGIGLGRKNSHQGPALSRGNSWAISLPKKRHSELPTSSGTAGHTRVFSETAVPSTKPNLLSGLRFERENRRASSAMGAAAHERLKQQDNLDQSTENSRSALGSSGSRFHLPLEPLNEDDQGLYPLQCLSHETSPLPRLETRSSSRFSSASSGLFEGNQPGLTRARSNIQLRDLREQMQDLKGKITSLKQRTHEDNLQRQSLQILKSPSPFTVAKDWNSPSSFLQHSPQTSEPEADIKAPQQAEDIATIPLLVTPSQIEERVDEIRDNDKPTDLETHAEDGVSDVYFDSELPVDSPKTVSQDGIDGLPPLPGPGDDDTILWRPISQCAEIFNADDEDDVSGEGEEPTQAEESRHKDVRSEEEEVDGEEGVDEAEVIEEEVPPSAVHSAIGERHEDRPDAFDYEHFFLHSAMGSYSRQGGRRDSFSSSGSEMTTKPLAPHIEEPEEISDEEDNQKEEGDDLSTLHPLATLNAMHSMRGQHSRKASTDSFSTVASFATAVEGEVEPVRSNSSRSRTKNRRVLNGTYLTPISIYGVSGLHSATSLAPDPSSISSQVLATLLTASSLTGGTVSRGKLANADEALIRSLIENLQSACSSLYDDADDNARHDNRIWRQRLRNARQILEGESLGYDP